MTTTPPPVARIRLAAGLADRFGATLIGFAAAAAIPPPVTAPPFGPAVAVEVLEAEQRRVEAELRAAHERFRAAAERDGRRTGWRSFFDRPADALAREARAADLLVIGRGRGASWQETVWAADPGDVLMTREAFEDYLHNRLDVVTDGAAALAGGKVLAALVVAGGRSGELFERGGPRGWRVGCSPARAAPGPKVPVIGVGGKTWRCEPMVASEEVLGPSERPAAALMARDAAFLWRPRKAVADGAGRGSKIGRAHV